MQRSISSTLKDEFQEIRAGFRVLGRAIKSWFDRRQALRASSLTRNDNAEVNSAGGTMGEDAVFSGPEQQIELLGEILHVDKERIGRGEIVVHKEVVTETQLIEVPVVREELVIERRSPNGQVVDDGVFGGKTELRIPLWEERAVIQKQPVVRQIVSVTKRRITESKEITDDVRHEELRVERQGDVDVKEIRGRGEINRAA